ncbi:MAG: hypothetical protein AB7F86_12930 [Bdellovibrionales bacterium]
MLKWTLISFLALLGWSSAARVQYSLRYNQVSCTSCHFSPSGGGPRTRQGKLFGAHGYAMNPSLAQEYLSADLKILYYRSQKSKASRGGMGVMSGAIAGHAWLDKDERNLFMIQHNVAGFSQAPMMDTYFLTKTQSAWAKAILIGRFRPAFGIVTDEHRTYTRMQSSTDSLNLETGAMVSGEPYANWHYDLSLVNGAHNQGSSLAKDQADQWGALLNLRYLQTPWLVGVSGSHFEPNQQKLSRRAWSLYGGVQWQDLNVFLERVSARGFNSQLGKGFAADSAYVTSIESSESEGWLSLWEYSLSLRFQLIYKFDYLMPDIRYRSDFYERHGIGFRWAVGPGVLWLVRLEKARATHPTEASGPSIGNQDAAFSVLQVAL